LRKTNQQRIAAQIAPGSAARLTPRLRRNRGRIEAQNVFAKLRTSRWMKAKGSANEAVIEFIGQAGRIARTTTKACGIVSAPAGRSISTPSVNCWASPTPTCPSSNPSSSNTSPADVVTPPQQQLQLAPSPRARQHWCP